MSYIKEMMIDNPIRLDDGKLAHIYTMPNFKPNEPWVCAWINGLDFSMGNYEEVPDDRQVLVRDSLEECLETVNDYVHCVYYSEMVRGKTLIDYVKFRGGVMTRGIDAKQKESKKFNDEVGEALNKFLTLQWLDLFNIEHFDNTVNYCDAHSNYRVLLEKCEYGRILQSFPTSEGNIWINCGYEPYTATEARIMITILFPDEY